MESGIKLTFSNILSKKQRAEDGGFTLIELSIVLIILAILASFAIPRLFIITEINLRSSARKLAETIRLVHSLSISNASQFMIRYDIDKGTYTYVEGIEDRPGHWLFQFHDRLEDQASISTIKGKTFHLDRGVFFHDIYDLIGERKYEKGIVRTEFSPRGITTPLLIHLGDKKARFYTILIDRYGGRVELRKGNLSYAEFFSGLNQ